MIPSAFEYERATSLDDALGRLAAANGAGRLLAGGHSLVPLMKLKLTEPTVLIDIARIPELAGVREHDGIIEVGALSVHHDVATSALLQGAVPGRGRYPQRPSETLRFGTAARSEGASLTLIRPPTIRR